MTKGALARDINGALWRVTEVRATRYGFDVLIGRPHPASRQGAAIILTDDLVCILHKLRHEPRHLAETLPIGATAIKRLRRAIGHHWRDDRQAFYAARIDDLGDLTGPQFAARHGVSEAAASIWRCLLIGQRQRPSGWWRQVDHRDMLMTGPARDAADALQIPLGSVRRLRWTINNEGLHDPDK